MTLTNQLTSQMENFSSFIINFISLDLYKIRRKSEWITRANHIYLISSYFVLDKRPILFTHSSYKHLFSFQGMCLYIESRVKIIGKGKKETIATTFLFQEFPNKKMKKSLLHIFTKMTPPVYDFIVKWNWSQLG